VAHDKELEERIDLLSLNWPGLSKKKMFGGVGYLLNGNMACGIWKASLVVRCGAESYGRYLALPDVSEFAVTGRPMVGWVLVGPDALAGEESLLGWLERGRDFAATLEAK
jgi:hypothetical protein